MGKSAWIVSVVCVLALGQAGCIAEVGESEAIEGASAQADTGTEVVSKVSDALLAGWASGPFTWNQGDPVRKLEPLSTHVCVLTRLSGKFRGSGEFVQVTYDSSRWWLQGDSDQAGVSGEATCFRREDFTAVGSTRAIGSYTANAWTRNISDHGCDNRIYDTALSDTFVFLQGIQGQFAGGGEFALVEQALSTNVRTRMQIQTCVRDQSINAFALSYRVGKTGRFATFVNRNGGRGDVYNVPEFVAEGNQDVEMAPGHKAMCGFTRIQGELQGGGESASIRLENDRWVLKTRQGAGSEYVRAHARCFARHQLD